MKLILWAVALFTAVTATAASDPTYSAFRAARPDGRTIAVTNLAFDRDVFHVTLDGTLHLLPPVAGKNAAAVFIGRGAYELTPASEVERRTLGVNAADPALKTFRDEFDSMVIFDADLMAQAAKASPIATGAADSAALAAWNRFANFEQRELKNNLHIRVLQAVLNGETAPLFMAFPAGKKFSHLLLILDNLGNVDGEETALYSGDDQRGGFWYSSHLRGEKPHGESKIASASHYTIDAAFNGRDELAATTTIDAVIGADGVRVLPLQLDPRLRIEDAAFSTDAKWETWTPLAFVQENEKEDGNAAVIFPQALEMGQPVAIRIKARGNGVLKSAGDGNFYVQARTAWYPNLGTFTEMATYDLTYRFPKGHEVVSVGEQTGDRIEGDQRVMSFKAAQPIRVAGFNFGKFRKISRTDKNTGLVVNVFTNPGTPDVIKEINAALEQYRQSGKVETEWTSVDVIGGPSQLFLDTNGLAESALADAMNTSRVASFYFGMSPLKRISITQQTQWDYGQSWPGLVYLPYLAVLGGTMRASFGLGGASEFIEQVGPHEMAHQWWGHTVGAATYHDAWLDEGFAEFTAGLVLQQTGGMKKYNDFWESARKFIVGRPVRAFIDNQEAGPITQGWRLATWRNQSAYAALVYNKGAYVLHMLRMMMQDRQNKENPDAAFIAMMSDYVRTYSGRNARTADFKAMVEKHMTPNLNATGNGKIDWFFNQWVEGTAIPGYTSKFEVKPAADGKFRITGSLIQAGVPEDFRALVPIYVEFDKGQVFKVAQIPMVGSSSRDLDFEVKLPKKPNKITLNAMHDVLSR
jgi:hypothetical protein